MVMPKLSLLGMVDKTVSWLNMHYLVCEKVLKLPTTVQLSMNVSSLSVPCLAPSVIVFSIAVYCPLPLPLFPPPPPPGLPWIHCRATAASLAFRRRESWEVKLFRGTAFYRFTVHLTRFFFFLNIMRLPWCKTGASARQVVSYFDLELPKCLKYWRKFKW